MPSALLVGGPHHMEVIDVPDDQSVLQILSHAGTPFYVGESASPPAWDNHIYYRVFDVKGPFALYEHATLRNSNVKRRAVVLDRERLEAADAYEHACQRERFAERAKEALRDELTSRINNVSVYEEKLKHARLELDTTRTSLDGARSRLVKRHNDAVAAGAKLNRINEERTKIAYDHGI